jgi:hypothetical protein
MEQDCKGIEVPDTVVDIDEHDCKAEVPMEQDCKGIEVPDTVVDIDEHDDCIVMATDTYFDTQTAAYDEHDCIVMATDTYFDTKTAAEVLPESDDKREEEKYEATQESDIHDKND